MKTMNALFIPFFWVLGMLVILFFIKQYQKKKNQNEKLQQLKDEVDAHDSVL